MSTTEINRQTSRADHTETCGVDRSCAPESDCCGGSADQTRGPETSRRGIKAALFAVLCASACLVVPLAAGGLAAVSGALAGEWWIAAVAVVVAVGVGVVMFRRRVGSIC